MFTFRKKQACARCGALFRGKGLSYVRPGTSRQELLCGQRCLNTAIDEHELARAAEKAARDEADANYRQALVDAWHRGEIVGLSTDASDGAAPVGFLGGSPRGLSLDAWPVHEDTPMLHLATLDLRRLHLGDGCVGVYCEAFRDEYGWTVGGEIRVLAVSGLAVDPAVSDVDEGRYPAQLLGARPLFTSASDPDFHATDGLPSFAGGAPVDFEGCPYVRHKGDGFVAQVATRLFHVGEELEDLFSEAAGLYVFEESADIDMFG